MSEKCILNIDFNKVSSAIFSRVLIFSTIILDYVGGSRNKYIESCFCTQDRFFEGVVKSCNGYSEYGKFNCI